MASKVENEAQATAPNKHVAPSLPASSEAYRYLQEILLADPNDAERQDDVQADLLALGQTRELAHLTVPTAIELVSNDISETEVQNVLQHLMHCSFCRDTLRQTLRLSGADENEHKAYVMLRRAEEWARRQDAGRAAAAEARAYLHSRGVGAVYQQGDSQLVEEFPDGTVRPYSRETKTATEDFTENRREG